MKALKFFLRFWGFIVGMFLTFAAMPVGDCRSHSDIENPSAYIEEAEKHDLMTYVIGHTCPDSDTVCSAIAYADFKKKFNLKCEPRIAGALNKETEFILNSFDVPTPPILDNAADKNIILVDHNILSQAITGMESARIVEILDHHNLFGDVKTDKPIFYLHMQVGCTATIVWLCYHKNNISIDKKMAGIMFGAILSDTDNLRSANTTNLDKQAANELQKIAGVKNRTKYFLDMEKNFTDYSNMTEREIIYIDFKNFTANNLNCGYATVATLTPADRNNLKIRLDNFMKKNFIAQNVDMFFIKIHDIETYTANILAYGENAAEIIAEINLRGDFENMPNKKIARAICRASEKINSHEIIFAA